MQHVLILLDKTNTIMKKTLETSYFMPEEQLIWSVGLQLGLCGLMTKEQDMEAIAPRNKCKGVR